MLTAIDAYSRERLAIEVARRLGSDDVLHLLAEPFVQHHPPDHIPSDNVDGYQSGLRGTRLIDGHGLTASKAVSRTSSL